MKTILKIIVSLLLLTNSIAAMYGGGHLTIQPDSMSQDLLEHTLFSDYLLPGIVLFITNGLFSFIVLGSIWLDHLNYYFLIILQGAVLTGWIILQILFIQNIYSLHILLGSVGIALMIGGTLLWLIETRIKTRVVGRSLSIPNWLIVELSNR
ncbi:MAG: hypothetical protein V4651_11530 [Bacteroidota bacterium]